jgi:uncharacterized protein YndB with AHSA1/START domain
MTRTDHSQTHSASRLIKASPQVIYRALVSADAVAAWRAPRGMTARILAFDPREGGSYVMALEYEGDDHALPGKSSEHADIVRGSFVELLPDRRVVELAEFESDDPAFAGTMTVTTTLTPVAGGTEVSIVCDNVPNGIKESDHQAGMASTLDNLAVFTEGA